MSLYSEAVTSTGAGAVADTFDVVGTVTLRDDATKLLGVWVVAAPVTGIAAEAIQGQVRLTVTGTDAQVFPAPPYMGGDPGTNVGFRGVLPEFVPFLHDVKGGPDVLVEYSTHLQDPTNANAVVACVVYEAGDGVQKAPPPADVMDRFPEMAPINAGGDSEANGQVLTVAETAITDLVIPNWASEVVGFKQTITPDLMTAAEEIIGFVRYRSSFTDYEPQEWPLNAYSAPLGTPVGTGGHIPAIPKMAAFLRAPNSRATISPRVVLVAAVTTGHSVVASAYYR